MKIAKEGQSWEIQNELGILKALDTDTVWQQTFSRLLDHDSPWIGKLKMVFDLYEGGDLVDGQRKHWNTYGDIPIETVSSILIQMLASIEYLHSRNVMHRDVKGDNFMLSNKDIRVPSLRVVIIDFGAAKEITSSPFSCLVGTTGDYRSPEMVKRKYTELCDEWACGVVAYGLMTRTFPFRDDEAILNNKITVDMILNGRTGPPANGLAELIEKLLTKDAGQRITAKNARIEVGQIMPGDLNEHGRKWVGDLPAP